MALFKPVRSVRATRDERTRSLPGDAVIPRPAQSLTYAITIQCPAGEVWPWLAQMGSRERGGWYSYDRIDNGGEPSTHRIMRRLQDVALGTTLRPLPNAPQGLTVVGFERDASLVLASRRHGRPAITWAFALEPLPHRRTRLVVRARVAADRRRDALLLTVARPFLHLGHFVMQRKQLLGIAARAERLAARIQPLQRDVA
jgi:hypothetical protein